jgi:AraC family transcriptional regulator
MSNHSMVLIGSRPAKAERRTHDGSYVSFTKGPGSLTVAPAGSVPDVRIYTSFELISLTLDKGFTRGIAEEMDKQPSGNPTFQSGICDASFTSLLRTLSEELETGGRSGKLYAETLAHALAIKFLLLPCPSKEYQAPTVKPLLPRLLNRVQERIDFELNRELSLDVLAKESGYSRAHFLRAFRAAIGLTPHQYILERRINRARQLLRQKQMALADVAIACGFSSQAHMTDIFRDHIGVTPGEYRRCL